MLQSSRHLHTTQGVLQHLGRRVLGLDVHGAARLFLHDGDAVGNVHLDTVKAVATRLIDERVRQNGGNLGLDLPIGRRVRREDPVGQVVFLRKLEKDLVIFTFGVGSDAVANDHAGDFVGLRMPSKASTIGIVVRLGVAAQEGVTSRGKLDYDLMGSNQPSTVQVALKEVKIGTRNLDAEAVVEDSIVHMVLKGHNDDLAVTLRIGWVDKDLGCIQVLDRLERKSWQGKRKILTEDVVFSEGSHLAGDFFQRVFKSSERKTQTGCW